MYSETSYSVVRGKFRCLRIVVAIFLATLLFSDIVSAQPLDPETVRLRKSAEKLEKNGNFLGCAKAYLAIYQASPQADRIDEVLYNAGVCFEENKSIDLAIGVYATLEKRFPKSRLTQKALVRLGSAYGATARFGQAARAYEKYARRYAGEKDAPYALQNAITYRSGMGQTKEAIANIEAFVKKYKKKLKREAAAVFLGLATIYENENNPQMAVKTYKRYIKEFGRSNGIDMLLVANAKIGELLWKQSCKSEENGVCLRTRLTKGVGRRSRKSVGQTQKLRTRCGATPKLEVTIVPRDRRLADEAYKYFEYAVSLAKRKGAIDSAPNLARKATATYWLKASRFYLVERKFEKYLSLGFPDTLNFSTRNEKKTMDSVKRLGQWVSDKRKLGKELRTRYGEIEYGDGSIAWAVAGAARVAQVSEHFSRVLSTSKIPMGMRTGPNAKIQVDAYCDAMAAQSTPSKNTALMAYEFCLGLSNKLNWLDSRSRFCMEKLVELQPKDYPTANEVHGPVDGIGGLTTIQGIPQ